MGSFAFPPIVPLTNLTLDWGDGGSYTVLQGNTSSNAHYYASDGVYNISIIGEVSGFQFNSAKLLEIVSWGSFTMNGTSGYAFAGCANLQKVPDAGQPVFLPGTVLTGMFQNNTKLNSSFNWDLTNVTKLDFMFDNAVSLNQPVNFSNSRGVIRTEFMFRGATSFNSALILDTSGVTDMTSMFQWASSFNQPIDFNTTNVGTMTAMFQGASSFNQPLNFNTVKVNSMSSMFSNATSFNQSLNFDTRQVLALNAMFNNASSFDQPLNFTSTTNVTTMKFMFAGASAFNQPLDFDTTAVSNMQAMFQYATTFNQPVNFNTAKVTRMENMFQGASSFNRLLPSFNTSQVASMEYMFSEAVNFNQPLDFDTRKVTAMASMFQGAVNFNQPLAFLTPVAKSMSHMFDGATSFNQLVPFDTHEVETMDSMFMGATNFNQVIAFDTGKVMYMTYMFGNATSFNQNITFNPTNLISVRGMFQGATSFNSEINLDTQAVNFFDSMFEGAASFNRAVNFSTPNAINMPRMFANAVNFNQTVTFSSTANVGGMSEMFLNVAGFQQSLVSWNTSNVLQCSNFCEWCGLPNFTSCITGNICGSRPPLQSPSKGAVCNCADCGTTRVVLNGTRTVITVVGNGTTFNVTIPSDPLFVVNGTVVVGILDPKNGSVSNVLSIVFLDPTGREANVTNLTTPVVVSFPYPSNPSLTLPVKKCVGTEVVIEPVLPRCGYFHEGSQTWETDGCSLSDIGSGFVQCSCTHLTDFAVLAPNANNLVPTQFLQLTPENISEHSTGLVAVLVVLGVFGVAFVLAFVRDRKERTQYEQLKLFKQEKWAKFAQKREKATIWKQIKIAFQKRHTWFSLFFRKRGTSFQSVDRTFVALFTVFASMTMSAHYHARDNNDLARIVIFISVIGTCWLPSQALSILFVHTGAMGFYEEWEQTNKPQTTPFNSWSSYRFPENWRYVWRAAAFMAVVGMIVAVLALSMLFDLEPYFFCKGAPAMSWVSTWVSAYAITVLAIEPFRILLAASVNFYVLSDFKVKAVEMSGTDTMQTETAEHTAAAAAAANTTTANTTTEDTEENAEDTAEDPAKDRLKES